MKTTEKVLEKKRASYMEWPFELNFQKDAFTMKFPAQKEGVQFPKVSTALVEDYFNIKFPINTIVTIPKTEKEIKLNEKAYHLPKSVTNRLKVEFPDGGIIKFPSNFNITQDPLPKYFKITGENVKIK